MRPVPFTFSGRIRRWPFFKGCVALALSAILPAVLAVGAYPAIRAGQRGVVIGLVALLVVFALVALWISLALQVRRCRDMGLDPWIVLPLWLGSQALDPFLPQLLSGLALHGGHGGTLIGAGVNLALMLALLLWPSRGEPEAAEPISNARVAARMALPGRQAPSVAAAASADSSRTAIPPGRMAFVRR